MVANDLHDIQSLLELGECGRHSLARLFDVAANVGRCLSHAKSPI